MGILERFLGRILTSSILSLTGLDTNKLIGFWKSKLLKQSLAWFLTYICVFCNLQPAIKIRATIIQVSQEFPTKRITDPKKERKKRYCTICMLINSKTCPSLTWDTDNSCTINAQIHRDRLSEVLTPKAVVCLIPSWARASHWRDESGHSERNGI